MMILLTCIHTKNKERVHALFETVKKYKKIDYNKMNEYEYICLIHQSGTVRAVKKENDSVLCPGIST